MKKDSKQRLFEVMGRLDKTFKPKLNEGLEDIISTDAEVETPEVPVEEKSIEEKYEELKGKVEELYGLIHGEETPAEETPEEPVEIPAEEPAEETPEEPEEEKEEKPEEIEEEKKPKIPVADIAKVGGK